MCPQGGVEQVAVRALLSNLWDAGRETHAVTWSAPFPSRVRHTKEKPMATLLSELYWEPYRRSPYFVAGWLVGMMSLAPWPRPSSATTANW